MCMYEISDNEENPISYKKKCPFKKSTTADQQHANICKT